MDSDENDFRNGFRLILHSGIFHDLSANDKQSKVPDRPRVLRTNSQKLFIRFAVEHTYGVKIIKIAIRYELST